MNFQVIITRFGVYFKITARWHLIQVTEYLLYTPLTLLHSLDCIEIITIFSIHGPNKSNQDIRMKITCNRLKKLLQTTTTLESKRHLMNVNSLY
jgi:hypothetical protein